MWTNIHNPWCYHDISFLSTWFFFHNHFLGGWNARMLFIVVIQPPLLPKTHCEQWLSCTDWSLVHGRVTGDLQSHVLWLVMVILALFAPLCSLDGNVLQASHLDSPRILQLNVRLHERTCQCMLLVLMLKFNGFKSSLRLYCFLYQEMRSAILPRQAWIKDVLYLFCRVGHVHVHFCCKAHLKVASI